MTDATLLAAPAADRTPRRTWEEEFARSPPQEKFHARVFGTFASDEARAAALERHAAGTEVLGMVVLVAAPNPPLHRTGGAHRLETCSPPSPAGR